MNTVRSSPDDINFMAFLYVFRAFSLCIRIVYVCLMCLHVYVFVIHLFNTQEYSCVWYGIGTVWTVNKSKFNKFVIVVGVLNFNLYCRCIETHLIYLSTKSRTIEIDSIRFTNDFLFFLRNGLACMHHDL